MDIFHRAAVSPEADFREEAAEDFPAEAVPSAEAEAHEAFNGKYKKNAQLRLSVFLYI